MKNNKNKNAKNKIVKDENYDVLKDNLFRAEISLGSNITVKEKLTVDKKNDKLYYDDVVDAFYDMADDKYPESEFPKMEIKDIEVYSNEVKSWFPVFAESEKAKIKEAIDSRKYKRFLVLPEITYTLSKECKMWMKMKEQGLISEDEPFSYEKIHSLIDITKKG